MSRLGNTVIAEVYGESHSDRVGVKINNLPLGYAIDIAGIQADLDRRAAKNNLFSTPRIEADKLIISSGLIDNFTTGKEFDGYILNENVRPSSYNNLMNTPRPGHADYVARMKYGDEYSLSGGGNFSGRMTAPMVIMGGVARQILAARGVSIGAYIAEIGGINCGGYDNSSEDDVIINGRLPIKDSSQVSAVIELLNSVAASGDSIGGKIECVVKGVPIGIGGAMWEGLESRISNGLFGIPAVKAVEFGSGCGMSSMRGSEANDSFYYDDKHCVRTRTNHNGGINGGISNGMDITIRITVKPTPSISIEQDTIDINKGDNVKLSIKGRHDCCIVPRAVVVSEAIVAYSLMDIMAEENRL